MQLWLFHWERPDCLGLLGLLNPWLMRSEWLHYGYALLMLIGLWVFQSKMTTKKASFWWSLALWFQFYHHFEHAILLSQELLKVNFLNSSTPISIGQIWFPRIELHLFYNFIVFIPMIIALWYNRKLRIVVR
ncbi:hypothetical protein [Cyanothece sp. BG0011]|uniref:hypothetical protein n=1 Tax=Cyanothece sp. BG0011 TaxID=2082950 RepID=UPI000D1DAA07|nr:hypothetical protein [Cyanothece sp. BG0011]